MVPGNSATCHGKGIFRVLGAGSGTWAVVRTSLPRFFMTSPFAHLPAPPHSIRSFLIPTADQFSLGRTNPHSVQSKNLSAIDRVLESIFQLPPKPAIILKNMNQYSPFHFFLVAQSAFSSLDQNQAPISCEHSPGHSHAHMSLDPSQFAYLLNVSRGCAPTCYHPR